MHLECFNSNAHGFDGRTEMTISPKDKAGTKKMGKALNKMVQEDPSLQVATDEDSSETLIKGMGELHLDIKVDIKVNI